MALRNIEFKSKKIDISYEILNSTKKQNLIILHGWGSNKEIMQQAFSETMKEYKHIYIDMPGFGKSTNPMVLTTSDYATIIDIFLKSLKLDIDIAMGHSFGGKVATLLNPKYLVLLSSAGIITKKPWSIKVKIATFKLLKPLGMKKIRELFSSSDVKGMSHEMYETFKNVVDEDFTSEFKEFKNRAILFWGIEDTATPLYTGEQINTLIKDSKFYPLDGDHYFFLKHNKSIEKNLLEYL